MSQSTGVHCILELFECPFELLNDESFVRQSVIMAAAESASTLLSLTSHAFSPQGVTALGLLAESHVSIHTWPEKGYAAADVFTCGCNCDPQRACRLLTRLFQSGDHTLSVMQRGPELKSDTRSLPQQCYDKEPKQCFSHQPPYG